MKFISKFFLAATAATALYSCDKEPVNTDGDFQIQMEYQWAMSGAPFTMNTMLYHPMSGDSLKFTTFKHYLSNIKLHHVDGSVWEAPESYHLLNVDDPTSLVLDFTGVPAGEYNALEITFGVDSLRNVSGLQTGALDPANNMFWSWNTGYIMIKAMGESPQSPSGTFSYHLGGFSGANSTILTKELNFPAGELLEITPDGTPVIHTMANPAKLFHTQGTVANMPMIHMPNTEAGIMASDFNQGVFIDHVHL
jgi:hypothetical protein